MLACTIRASPTVKGVTLPGAASALPVLSQYADGTSLVLSSDQSIRSTFSSYFMFESGSGSKLNQAKSNGLSLGAWSVYLGPGNLEEENWRPRILAMENVLHSWRQRHLSLRGRSLIIGALDLARVWYVAPLIHMPPWAMFELNKLIFRFFWKGKPDRVSRAVVLQRTSASGFGVLSIRHKVWSLHAQWIKRFPSSPSAWASFISHFFGTALAASPLQVFSWPHLRDLNGLPEFYKSLVLAWRALDGGFSEQSSSLVLASQTPATAVSVAAMSFKLCYNVLVGNSWSSPHCVAKFAHSGDLYWSTTWRQLFFCPVDRPVIDLSWKIAHGVVCSPRLVFVTSVMMFLWRVFVGRGWRPSTICSFLVLWLSRVFRGFGLSYFVFVRLRFLFVVICCLGSVRTSYASCRAVLCTPSTYSSISSGWHGTTTVSAISVRMRCTFWRTLKSVSGLTNQFFYQRFKSSRRRRYFHRQWGARGVLAAVVDGRLILKI